MNRARSFKILVNGQEAGRIANGGSEELRVEPGPQRLACKIDWITSREFELNLAAGETAYLYVRSGLKYYWHFVIPLFIMVTLNFYFTFSNTQKPSWFNTALFVVCLPGILYILYYTLVNRKGYIAIEKDAKTGLN